MSLQTLLKPIVDVREEESRSALLMFLYSFLALTAYNILKPITRSQFISDLGSENLPYVQFGAGIVIGFIMQGYSKVTSLMPRKWVIPGAQLGAAGLLVLFWFLLQGGQSWVSVLLYLFGLILGILLVSQFWTLANEIYDPRQAKRLFGFIGGGSALGGILGSTILQFARQFGTTNLLLVSAVLLLICVTVVLAVLATRKDVSLEGVTSTGEEKGVKSGEAFRLLRGSRHLQLIALVISFAAIGAAIIEQQLNMSVDEQSRAEIEAARPQFEAALAAEFAEASAKGASAADLEKIRTDKEDALKKSVRDAITTRLGQVQLWLSIISLIVQVWLTSRIQRYLGIGFALMVLPVSLGLTGFIILATGAYASTWLARIADTSLRYSIDKTTREILFLPLPSELKLQAKPFVDVTVDRFSKGLGALLLLILIKPWGFSLNWRQLSYASLTLCALWVFGAIAAKRGYVKAFRRSLDQRDVAAADVRIQAADLSTVETLIAELAHPDEKRVLYAIDILESLEKRNLVTPLLLYHESPRVRARALQALGAARSDIARSWQPQVERLLTDPEATVRVAAMSALAQLRGQDVSNLVRPYVDDPDARLACSAAMVLAKRGTAADLDIAERTLERVAASAEPAARRDVALAVREGVDPHLHHVLVPLLYDSDASVAETALDSVRTLGSANFLFVPTLVSALRNRRLKGTARDVLVSYGPEVVPALAHFLADQDEDIWVRRHIPATLARIPSQQTMDTLVTALTREPDGFLRFKLLTAIDSLHRAHPELTFDPKPLQERALGQVTRYFTWLSLYHNLFDLAKLPADSLLAQALRGKMERAVNRIWLLLGVLHPWQDVSAARWAIERGDPKARASALEYLDNLLPGPIRKRVLPVLEDAPLEEKVARGNAIISTRPRDVEETLLQLINDDDQIVAAAAIHFAAKQKVWALAPDIEHVLAHRDPRDWFVFEAASWALAEQRMPEERVRQLWLEPLPAVELAARLRTIPIFAKVSVDELFRLGGTGRQVRYDPGVVLGTEGVIPNTLQFLLDGHVEARSQAGLVEQLEPVASLGFDQVVSGTPLAWTLKTTARCVCLDLTIEEWRTLLAENGDIVQGLFRTILDSSAFAGERFVIEGGPDAASELGRLAAEGVTAIEKVLALQKVGPFTQVAAEELLELANRSQRTTFAGGQTLVKAAEVPPVLIVLAGHLVLDDSGTTPVTSRAGDVVGLMEALAGVPLGHDVKASGEGLALRIGHLELLELLGERPLLLRQLFARLFR
jgi:AAA family ATP:ADP antiporter